MTRLLVPPPSNQPLTRAAPLAQPLRSRSADSTREGTGFRDALAEANDRAAKRDQRNEAGKSRDPQPADSKAPEAPEEKTPRAGEKGEETPSETPPVDQESAERSQTTEEAQATTDQPPETPIEADAEDAVPVEQKPAPVEADPATSLREADAPIVEGETVPAEQPDQALLAADDARVAASTGNRAESGTGERVIAHEAPPQPREPAPTETENQRHFRSVHAPTAEDQARESIDVATRFDAAIRDRVRHAAKVDLAALAAAKLTTPTDPAPGKSVTQSILERQLAPETSTGADTRAQTHTRREPEFAAHQPTPQRPSEQPAAGKLTSSPNDGPKTAQSSSPQGPATPSAPSTQTTPGAPTPVTTGPVLAGAAANLPQAQAQSTSRAFDRAITALRSLGADKATTKSKAPPGPGASAPKPGAENGKALLAQVSRGMASILRDQGGSLNIRLRPDTLGDLKIHLRVQGGGVEATFKADNAQARDLLESNLSKLKETLETNGVRVDRLRVELDNARTQDASGPRAEYRGHQGDGSPGFDDPSETGGRDGDSRHERHGSHDGAHGRAPQHGPGDQGASPTSPDALAALDAEADRGAAWIGVDTLA